MTATVIPTTPDKPGTAVLLAPTRDGWSIAVEGDDEAMTFPAFEAGLKRACDLARAAGTALYVKGSQGELVDKWEFFSQTTRPEAIHVQPAGDGWALRRHTNPTIGHFSTKADAIDMGRRLAKSQELDLIVHYETGEIQTSRSYDA